MKNLFTTLFIIGIFTLTARAQTLKADFTYTKACYGEATFLDASNSSCSPLDSIVLYAWDLDGDLSFDDAVGKTITHTFTGGGYDYNVGVKITTKFNFTAANYIAVKISDVWANFSYVSTCFGNETQFTSLATVVNDVIVDYTWDFGDGLASKDKDPKYTYKDWTMYNVTFSVETQNGCKADTTIPILITPVPVLTLTYSLDPVSYDNGVPNFEFFEGQSLTVNASVSGLYDKIEWSNGTTGTQQIFTQKGNYTVTVTDKEGCFSTLGFNIVTIKINDVDPFDVITPNGDGINDVFYIKPDILPGESYELIIYNRWGDQVYSSPEYKNDWMGQYDGKDLPEGAYYYIIKNNRNKDQVYNLVNILR